MKEETIQMKNNRAQAARDYILKKFYSITKKKCCAAGINKDNLKYL